MFLERVSLQEGGVLYLSVFESDFKRRGFTDFFGLGFLRLILEGGLVTSPLVLITTFVK